MFLSFLAITAASAAIINLLVANDAANDTANYQKDQLKLAQLSLAWEKEQADIANQAALTGMETDLDLLQTQLLADTAELGTYERALSKFDAYADVKKDTAVEAGRSTFDQLMGNYENTAAFMAATGRSGGSGTIVSNTAEKNLERYAGEDLVYNTTGGGLFADQYQQLVADLTEEKTGITEQIGVFEESIGILVASIGTTEAGIADLEAALL